MMPSIAHENAPSSIWEANGIDITQTIKIELF